MLPLLTVFLMIETPNVIIIQCFIAYHHQALTFTVGMTLELESKASQVVDWERGKEHHPFLLPRLLLKSR